MTYRTYEAVLWWHLLPVSVSYENWVSHVVSVASFSINLTVRLQNDIVASAWNIAEETVVAMLDTEPSTEK